MKCQPYDPSHPVLVPAWTFPIDFNLLGLTPTEIGAFSYKNGHETTTADLRLTAAPAVLECCSGNKKDDKKSMEQGKEICDHLKSEFQKMQPKEAAPERLKKQVFDTLDTIQLMADVADLFTVKFSKTES